MQESSSTKYEQPKKRAGQNIGKSWSKNYIHMKSSNSRATTPLSLVVFLFPFFLALEKLSVPSVPYLLHLI